MPTPSIFFLLFGTMLIRALKILYFGLSICSAKVFSLKMQIYFAFYFVLTLISLFP